MCHFPMSARRSSTMNPETRKFGITFSGTRALIEGSKVMLPCGVCLGCRVDRAAGWAIRSNHEAKMVQSEGRESAFITLTFDDEHLPDDNSLRKFHFQNFMKRLRKAIAPLKVRYLACGEYGSKKGRAHYHAILFGYGFPDRKVWRQTERGERVYVSAQLTELWPFGFHEIGSVTFQSSRYVAAYVMKKRSPGKGDKYDDFYVRSSPVTGEVVEVEPEFQLVSNDPGLGKTWFDKFKADVYPSDFVIVDGKRHKVPRFYDKQLSEEEFEEVRKRRRVEARKRVEDRSFERRSVIAECNALKMRRLPRFQEE